MMRAALALARRGLGSTWPNPSVGCVIVRDGRVIARARTAPGGRPHAETQALAQAGAAAQGATAYVTLEPCSHHGGTPPCADALVDAGVARVVVGATDADPRVNGAGIARLRRAGVAVEVLESAEAADILAGFATRVRLGRPLVTLKLATTLDGRIATAAGESRWITGAAARRAVHAMRARHDATMVGIGTALADDPDLTCRIPGFAARPNWRVVADSRARLPIDGKLATGAPTVLLHGDGADAERLAALTQAGVRCVPVDSGASGLDPAAMFAALGRLGMTSVLVEGGAGLASALLRAGLVDRLVWFHAPALLGDGLPALHRLGTALADMPRFTLTHIGMVGEDMVSHYIR